MRLIHVGIYTNDRKSDFGCAENADLQTDGNRFDSRRVHFLHSELRACVVWKQLNPVSGLGILVLAAFGVVVGALMGTLTTLKKPSDETEKS
jgi:hypothetical protein